MTIITPLDAAHLAVAHAPATIAARAWHDIAPKLLAYLATGLTGSAVVSLLATFNITVAPGFAAAVVVAVGAIAGYFTPDNGKAS